MSSSDNMQLILPQQKYHCLKSEQKYYMSNLDGVSLLYI